MKPGIDLVSVFEKKQDENGGEYFTGTMDIKTLKKIKGDELRVVIMNGNLLPKSLHSLMGKSVSETNGLFMFVENSKSHDS